MRDSSYSLSLAHASVATLNLAALNIQLHHQFPPTLGEFGQVEADALQNDFELVHTQGSRLVGIDALGECTNEVISQLSIDARVDVFVLGSHSGCWWLQCISVETLGKVLGRALELFDGDFLLVGDADDDLVLKGWWPFVDDVQAAELGAVLVTNLLQPSECCLKQKAVGFMHGVNGEETIAKVEWHQT